MANVRLDGRKGILHFIRFPTAEMDKFILLCKMKNLKSVAKTICATGETLRKRWKIIVFVVFAVIVVVAVVAVIVLVVVVVVFEDVLFW